MQKSHCHLLYEARGCSSRSSSDLGRAFPKYAYYLEISLSDSAALPDHPVSDWIHRVLGVDCPDWISPQRGHLSHECTSMAKRPDIDETPSYLTHTGEARTRTRSSSSGRSCDNCVYNSPLPTGLQASGQTFKSLYRAL